VQWFCRDFAEIYHSIAIVTELTWRPRGPDRLATVVYRCVQELLNNVASMRMPATYWSAVAREAC